MCIKLKRNKIESSNEEEISTQEMSGMTLITTRASGTEQLNLIFFCKTLQKTTKIYETFQKNKPKLVQTPLQIKVWQSSSMNLSIEKSPVVRNFIILTNRIVLSVNNFTTYKTIDL